MTLRYDQIADLIKIIDASACDEVVLETSEMKLVLRRRGLREGSPAGVGFARAETPPPTVAPAVAAPAYSAAPDPAQPSVSGRHEIRAPMVGTFYRATSPDAPPLVEVASKVVAGQPLCVIEVMKLFTTIFSHVAGTVVQVNADNAELVEYGRVLFVIE